MSVIYGLLGISITPEVPVQVIKSAKVEKLGAPTALVASVDGVDLLFSGRVCNTPYIIERSYDNKIWETAAITTFYSNTSYDPVYSQCEKDYIDSSFAKTKTKIFYRYGIYKNREPVAWSDVGEVKLDFELK